MKLKTLAVLIAGAALAVSLCACSGGSSSSLKEYASAKTSDGYTNDKWLEKENDMIALSKNGAHTSMGLFGEWYREAGYGVVSDYYKGSEVVVRGTVEEIHDSSDGRVVSLNKASCGRDSSRKEIYEAYAYATLANKDVEKYSISVGDQVILKGTVDSVSNTYKTDTSFNTTIIYSMGLKKASVGNITDDKF